MPEHDPLRMPLTSLDPSAERLAALRELFPDAFTEGALDAERLMALIGQPRKGGPERYGLSWAGKADALRAVQSLSTGTLRPQVDQSVDWDTTGNLIIEGDNLEALKLLQKSYHKRVKMIYIDPPYNTGNEFIYPDNFREGLQTYLEYTGQAKNGVRQSTNAETSGRYHSNWLSMMYPRLFLARNLLKEDGVIFVSIDDHEVHNLRLLMNEIFGEENYYVTFVWQKKDTPSNDAQGISVTHEYVVAYVRSPEFVRQLIPRTDEQVGIYKNPDKDERGPWTRTALTRKEFVARDYYPLKNPQGREILPPPGTSWRVSRQTLQRLIDEQRLWWGRDNDGDMPYVKRFLTEVQSGVVPTTWWDYEFAGSNRNAKLDMRSLFNNDPPFDTPKPSSLIKRLLSISTIAVEPGAIILDFFAGSGTTGQAVMELNKEDGGNRKFILVQLPEPTGNSEFPTIADITRERVRRAAKKLNGADKEVLPLSEETQPDRGFKAFTLDGSNLKVWNGDVTDGDALAEQLELFADHRLPDRSVQDVLYELLLKSGRSLTAPIVERSLAGQTVYDVDGGELLICLEDPIAEPTLRAMIERNPKRVLCLDGAFKGNDQLKTNIVLQMKDAKVEFRTV